MEHHLRRPVPCFPGVFTVRPSSSQGRCHSALLVPREFQQVRHLPKPSATSSVPPLLAPLPGSSPRVPATCIAPEDMQPPRAPLPRYLLAMLLPCLCSRPLQPLPALNFLYEASTTRMRPAHRVSSLLCEHGIIFHLVQLLRFVQLCQGIPPGSPSSPTADHFGYAKILTIKYHDVRRSPSTPSDTQVPRRSTDA